MGSVFAAGVRRSPRGRALLFLHYAAGPRRRPSRKIMAANLGARMEPPRLRRLYAARDALWLHQMPRTMKSRVRNEGPSLCRCSSRCRSGNAGRPLALKPSCAERCEAGAVGRGKLLAIHRISQQGLRMPCFGHIQTAPFLPSGKPFSPNGKKNTYLACGRAQPNFKT